MKKADSLSRQPNWQKGIEKDNKDRMLLKKKQLKVRAAQVVEVIIDRVDLLEKIRQSEVKDNKVIKVMEKIK